MEDDKKYEPPHSDSGDKLHSIAKAVISAVPYIGGPGVELFQMVVVPPLEKRRAEWMDEIAKGLRMLEEQGKIKIEDLNSDDNFVDTVLHCTQLVLRNSQEEKRRALRNAVLNSALPEKTDQSRQQIFLNLIDVLTVWHLKILALLQDPMAWYSKHDKKFPDFVYTANLTQVLEDAFPELRGQRTFYDHVWADLHQRGLIGTDSPHGMMTPNGVRAKRTTDIGDQFMKFIEDPI